MHIRLKHLIFAALVIALVSLAYGINYMYLSDCEITRFGDRIKFWHGDTLYAQVHSNSQIAIEQDPVFYGQVSTTACNFWLTGGANPYFLGPPPQFRAPRVEIPHTAEGLRDCAAAQGMFFSTPNKTYRVSLRGSEARIFRYWTGLPFDSSDATSVTLGRNRCIFFNGPVEISGYMIGEASIGCSGTMLLLDNVLYNDADSLDGVTPATSNNYLMLVAEGDIKVANTFGNGRNDSNNRGNGQTNRDSSSIVIAAALVALGESFTFEQQNDADSGYVFQYPPGNNHVDDRGQILLFGSLAQMRRGYVHRATPPNSPTGSSTGYLKQYRWDPRFTLWTPPGALPFDLPPGHTTDTLDFGGALVGHTVWDTATVIPEGSCNLGSVIASSPFWATRVPPFYANQFHIPVSFTPPHIGSFTGLLYVYTPYHYYQIVLRGMGLPGGAPGPVVFNVSPNPFNLTTTLHYSLEQPDAVKIILYDVLGRVAKTVELGAQEIGDHSAQLNAIGLASGVYFVRLQAGNHSVMQKILLLK